MVVEDFITLSDTSAKFEGAMYLKDEYVQREVKKDRLYSIYCIMCGLCYMFAIACLPGTLTKHIVTSVFFAFFVILGTLFVFLMCNVLWSFYDYSVAFKEQVSEALGGKGWCITRAHKLIEFDIKDIECLFVVKNSFYFRVKDIGDVKEECVMLTVDDAKAFFIELERVHYDWYVEMLGIEATKQLMGSSVYVEWLSEYLCDVKKTVANCCYSRLNTNLYFTTEQDFVQFLDWLVPNKLRITRTEAKKYAILLSAYKQYWQI